MKLKIIWVTMSNNKPKTEVASENNFEIPS